MTEDLAAAIAHHRAGRLAEAERIYRQFLEKNPRQPDLLHLLGGIAYQNGDLETAVKHFDAAAAAGLGATSDTLHFNRGNALKALNRRDEAVAAFKRSVEINPSNAMGYYNLGLLLHEKGRLEEADSAYRMALALGPDHAPGWNNLGVLMHEQGKLIDAEAALRLSLQQQPDFPDALFNLSRLFWHTGRAAEAEETIRRLLERFPDHPAALRVLGDSLLSQGRREEAIATYRRCVERAPEMAEAHINLGVALADANRIEEAEAAYRQAMAADPDDAAAHRSLGTLLQRVGRRAEAVEAYRRAVDLDPNDDEARFGLTIAQLPIIADSEADLAESRTAYERHLRALQAEFDLAPPERRAVAARAVGLMQPFYLAYQGRNDRELQADYGGLCWSLMAARHPRWSIPPTPRRRTQGHPVRVGFVSGFFNWHSVWTIPLRGWIAEIDRSRFKVHAYYTQGGRDETTAAAEAMADVFVPGPRPLEWWAERILEDQIDVLIYPEIGMDPMTARLACLRLAPVQCTSLGHPQTSGLPTMDFFLSSELMEPPDADEHYSERLVRLPNLGVHYTPACPDRPLLERADLGLPTEAVLYWCCQSLYKYRPLYDEVFVRIAEKVPEACFVFIEAPYAPITDAFRTRLAQAFAAAGLDFGRHVRFVRRLTTGEFAAVAALCDVFLDSIGWSGFNTTLESVHWGLPVVTLPGPLMRGRHAHAVLAMAGLTDTEARDVDHYVALAAALGRDPLLRAEASGRTLAARERLYGDRSAVTGLETFLERAAGPATG